MVNTTLLSAIAAMLQTHEDKRRRVWESQIGHRATSGGRARPLDRQNHGKGESKVHRMMAKASQRINRKRGK
jgi:hypothetical protein